MADLPEIARPKLRVAAYARVSTEQDEQQNSYEAQVDYYTHYIASNPEWEFVGIFSDEGISGTNTKKREGFNRMIGLAMNGGIDLILTKSISRFARNTVDTLETVRSLKAKGVEVWFEKENLRTLDAKGEMLLTIMSSLAQEESRSISENVRWGHRRSMEKGNVLLAYKNFLGYKKGEDGRPEIVEEEAVIVRQIYQLFLEGHTINDIARTLTEEGIPTPGGKKKWSVSTVKSILTNEKYRGSVLRQKSYTVDFLTKEVKKNHGEVKQYLVEDSHDAIIDPETFARVQEKIEAQSVKCKRNSSPFTKCFVCGDCGTYYGHKVWRLRSTDEPYDVWYCNHRYDVKKCQSPILREADIIFAFMGLLRVLGRSEQEALGSTPEEQKEGKTAVNEALWRELVDTVTVFQDHFTFSLQDGNEVTVPARAKE